MAMPTFKVLILGDMCSGKTCLSHNVLGFPSRPGYVPTLGVEVNPLRMKFQTSNGQEQSVCLNLWDIAGNPRFAGLGDGYFLQTSAAIIVVRSDLPIDKQSQSIDSWLTSFRRVAGNVPVLIVVTNFQGTKPIRPLSPGTLSRYRACGSCHVDLQNRENCFNPFILLVKQLLNDHNLDFIPPTNEETQATSYALMEDETNYQRQRLLAENTPLPDE